MAQRRGDVQHDQREHDVPSRPWTLCPSFAAAPDIGSKGIGKSPNHAIGRSGAGLDDSIQPVSGRASNRM